MESTMKTKKYILIVISVLAITLGSIGNYQPAQADENLHLTLANQNAKTSLSTPTTRYVAIDGTDNGMCDSVLGRCRTLQYAIDVADPGDEVRVGGGTYAPGETVARITEAVRITGGYNPEFSKSDPEMYETVLDAGKNGSVVYIDNAHSVTLKHLTLTNGDGNYNCGKDRGCGGGV